MGDLHEASLSNGDFSQHGLRTFEGLENSVVRLIRSISKAFIVDHQTTIKPCVPLIFLSLALLAVGAGSLAVKSVGAITERLLFRIPD